MPGYNTYMNAINPQRRMLPQGNDFSIDPNMGFDPNYNPMSDPNMGVDPSLTGGDTPSPDGGADPYIAGGIAAGSLIAPMLGKGTRAGQTFGGVLSGAGTGAAIGSIVPGVGTAIGAGVGALVGGIEGLTSKSEEEKRQARMDELRKRYAEAEGQLQTNEQNAESTGAMEIGRQTSGLMKRFKASGASRAAALGKIGSSARFESSGEQGAANEGANALSTYINRTQQGYASQEDALRHQELQDEGQFAMNAPIQPGIPDYLSELAPEAVKFAQQNRLANAYKNIYANRGTPTY